MNILFICPSNTKFMPYISYYNNHKLYGVRNRYIIWDRFSNEDYTQEKSIYSDGLIGHKRGFLSYLKYIFYLYFKLLSTHKGEDKMVIFGLQLTFFLIPYLFITRKKYIIDVRDYHYLFKLIPSFIFKKANFVAVSSPAYIKLFERNTKCIMSHNLYDYVDKFVKPLDNISLPIHVSCIGAIRDFCAQKKLIDNLSNNTNFLILFHGMGDVVPNLKKYILDRNILNVEFTGHYNKNDEYKFYEKSSIINMLRDNEDYNDRVALPNRLYSSAYFYRPSICYEGSALADIVKEYSLGLCIDHNDDIEESLSKYFENFHYIRFKENCDNFLNYVKKDQNLFNECLYEFIKLKI